MGLIVTDQRFAPQLLNWLDQRCPGIAKLEGTQYVIAYVTPEPDGIARESDVQCVVAINRFTHATCEASIAIAPGPSRRVNREFIWTVFDYVFNQAQRSRFYTFVSTRNQASLDLQRGLGFDALTTISDHYGVGEDAVLFGMTAPQWRTGKFAVKTRGR